MYKVIFFLLIFMSANELFGQIDTVATNSNVQNGKVYFMRRTGFSGSLTAFTVFIDDQVVCKLNNKMFSVHEVAPGDHTFSVQFAGKESKTKAERIDITIEPGEEYYVQLIIKSGLTNNLFCQEVTKNSAKTIMPTLKEDTRCLME